MAIDSPHSHVELERYEALLRCPQSEIIEIRSAGLRFLFDQSNSFNFQGYPWQIHRLA
jgi:hypothetical protein